MVSRGRNSQSSRQIVIAQMLEAAGRRGLSPREITERLADHGYSVTKRTVHRDIAGLQAAGMPFTESGSKSDDRGVCWRLDNVVAGRRSGPTAVLQISRQQLAGLYLAKAQFKSLTNNPLFRGLDYLFEQVSNLIGSKNRQLLDEMSHGFHVSDQPQIADASPEMIETIQAAMSEQQCLSVRYQSANSGTNRVRELGPHYLFFRDHGLYLVAEDLVEAKVKTFAVTRMSEVSLLDKPYRGEVTSPDTLFNGSFGVWRAKDICDVRIWFKANRAAYISERQWHPSQSIQKHEDGSITLNLQVGVTPQLVCWVLGFGADAEVTDPKKLQDEVAATASAIASQYLRKAG